MSSDAIDLYLEAAVAASSRVRAVLAVIVTAAVIISGTVWNSRRHNWMDARIALAQTALRYSNSKVPLHLMSVIEREERLLAEEAFGQWSHDEIAKLVDDLVRLDSTELTLVRAFGLTFDLNDRGFLAGATLCAVVVWLRWSLQREEENTRFLFENSRSRLKDCYHVLAMHQVIIRPPISRAVRKTIGGTALSLFCLPAIVQALAYWQDVSTYETAFRLSQRNALLMVGTSFLFFVVLVVLTYDCVATTRRILRAWNDAAAIVFGQAESLQAVPQPHPVEVES